MQLHVSIEARTEVGAPAGGLNHAGVKMAPGGRMPRDGVNASILSLNSVPSSRSIPRYLLLTVPANCFIRVPMSFSSHSWLIPCNSSSSSSRQTPHTKLHNAQPCNTTYVNVSISHGLHAGQESQTEPRQHFACQERRAAVLANPHDYHVYCSLRQRDTRVLRVHIHTASASGGTWREQH